MSVVQQSTPVSAFGKVFRKWNWHIEAKDAGKTVRFAILLWNGRSTPDVWIYPTSSRRSSKAKALAKKRQPGERSSSWILGTPVVVPTGRGTLKINTSGKEFNSRVSKARQTSTTKKKSATATKKKPTTRSKRLLL